MSIRTVSASPTTSNAGLNTKSLQGGVTSTPWVRNPQWLTLPTVLSTDQKFVGLHAIFPSANFLALVAAGDYTVDWGDGVTENFASGVVAYHEYDYANVAFDGTLTDLGYKQAIVTVTPQAGQNLTYLNLNQKHNQVGLNAYASGFLDISISSAELTDLRVAVSTPSTTSGVINFNLLEQASIINSDCRQLTNLFRSCRQLQSIEDFVTSSFTPVSKAVTFTDSGDLITSAAHGFRNGDSVLFTSVVSTTGITVETQYYIINVTTDTFQVSTTYGGSAAALTTDGTGVALYGTSMSTMFNNCNSLTSVPLFNTVNVTNMSNMFQNCQSLTSVTLFNTVNVTTMQNMFNNCPSLTSVPLFNTVNVTNISGMFISCVSLTSVPLFNTVAVTTMQSMFNSCQSLTLVPLFNTANVTTMASMFSNCVSLTSVPALVTTAITASSGFNSTFNACASLTKIEAKDFRFTFSVANCKLSAAALNEIYTNLPTVTGQTITVSGNYGTTGDDPTIATAKGWTVSG